MRKLIILFSVVLTFSATAFAQTSPPQMSEEKIALYTKYYELKKGGAEGQKVAYDVAKEYLQKFGSDDDQYTLAVKKFVALYERATLEVNFFKHYNAKEYGKSFEVGKQILNLEPENFLVMGSMVRAAYLNSYGGNQSLNTEAIALARKALPMLDSGNLAKADPFTSVDDARGFLNFALGWFLKDKSPVEAADAFTKAAQFGSTKSDPSTYFFLGAAIMSGDYDRLSTEYSTKFKGKDETPESKAALDQVLQVGNRAVDAYARAVALSTKPDQEKFKTKVMMELTDLYKGLHNNSDEGLNDLVAGVLSKPVPQPQPHP
jgi:hypothetical protein